MHDIKAIIFDYGNVIARFDHRIFFDKIRAYSSLSLSDMLGIIRNGSQLIIEYECGRLSSHEFFQQTADRLRLAISEEEFRILFVDIFERIPQTLELISLLSSTYKLGLLSNTNEWHYQSEIKPLDELTHFDAVTLSFQVGAMKPSERIYHDMLAKLNLPPGQCVYIDDIQDYVDASKRLGFNSVCYVSHDELLESLSAFGINV